MTARTTRNKLRFQAEKAIKRLDESLAHIQKLDEMAQGQSDYINENAPKLAILHEQYRKILVAFREGL